MVCVAVVSCQGDVGPPFWNAVGKTGQHMLTECGSDLEKAKELFRKK